MPANRCHRIRPRLLNVRPLRFLVATLVLLVPVGLIAEPAGAAPISVEAIVANSRLTVTGTDGPDQVALRLRLGDPAIVEVDVGLNGSADFSFDRATFTAIDVN